MGNDVNYFSKLKWFLLFHVSWNSTEKVKICYFILDKQTCYGGWKAEYTGFLMTEHKTHNNKEYACVDKDAEPIESDSTDLNGALFYAVRTTCDSLKCPPYKNHTTMLCVVCTI